jgi:transposase
MLQKNFITKLLGLSNVCVDDIQESNGIFHIKISTPVQEQICPRCGHTTSKIHDYRLQVIRDVAIRGNKVYLFLNKRRYVCPHCGKRFGEKYAFLPKYAHFSANVYLSIIDSLYSKRSLKDIAEEHNVSIAVVMRILNRISFKNRPPLPTVMGIDEFKGNTNGEKYQVILTDVQHKKVVNILPNRYKSSLVDHFIQYPYEERKKVRVLVMDMWEPYKELAWLFPNAKIVADKYHWVRQINWALDKVRKRVQDKLSPKTRLYFKRFRRVLQKKHSELDDEGKIIVLNMIEKDTDLYNAWQLKEMFYEFKDCKRMKKARKLLLNFIVEAENLGIPEFKDCITAMHDWATPILNGFQHKYTNGFTEGCNNTIKVIKRISYGYQNFEHLKKRILLTFAA